MKRIAVLACSLALACGPTANPPAPVVSATLESTSSRRSILERADETLHESQTVDLDAAIPSLALRALHERSISLYVQACDDGAMRGCWMALSMGLDKPRATLAAAKLARACRDGDFMSCRAGLSTPGDRAPLETECAQGYPASCEQLSADRGDKMSPRIRELLTDGCEQGIHAECFSLVNEDSEAFWTRSCVLAPRSGACDIINEGRTFEKYGTETRDALERECVMYGESNRCVNLVLQYAQKAFPQPRPGRAKALHARFCSEPGEQLCAMLDKLELRKDFDALP